MGLVDPALVLAAVLTVIGASRIRPQQVAVGLLPHRSVPRKAGTLALECLAAFYRSGPCSPFAVRVPSLPSRCGLLKVFSVEM